MRTLAILARSFAGSRRFTLFGICLFAVSLSWAANATCWRIGEFAGQSARASSSFSIEADGFTGQTFQMTVHESSASLRTGAGQPFPGLSCNRLNATSVICVGTNGNAVSVETWVVDTKTSRAFHTKTMTGYGPFDGGNLFVGRVLGRC